MITHEKKQNNLNSQISGLNNLNARFVQVVKNNNRVVYRFQNKYKNTTQME